MILIGLDHQASRTLAVLTDEKGRVLSRSTHDTLDAARKSTRQRNKPSVVGLVERNGASTDSGVAVHPGAAIALAEQWVGAAKDAPIVVALTLESSIHAGIVVGGRLFKGAHDEAGGARWLALNPVERDDYRRLGGLEAEVGAASIVRRFVWRIKAGDRSRVEEMAGGNLNAINVEQIYEAARAGDGVAASVVRDTARYIAMGTAAFVAVLDPDVVVLAGAIAELEDLLLEPVRADLRRRISPTARAKVAIVAPVLGSESAAIGAARAALLESPAPSRRKR